MDNFYSEESYYDCIKFHLDYDSPYLPYRISTTIAVEEDYVDKMRDFLENLGFEKVVEE